MMTSVKEIPLNKLVPSAANVRKTGAAAGLEELTASILAHGLLQNLQVRPVLDGDGAETGKYEVVAGARRLAAMKLLAKQKKVAKSAPVPCALIEADNPAEISLAENVVRTAMHPADQYEAFATLRDEQGLGAEEIAARFGITPAVVQQRLKLAAVSPQLMAVYRSGEMNLDQLMAFAITDDHARQEAVWAGLSWNKGPEAIRRALTSAHVGARDKRAVFVGIESYAAAGGVILRDLFQDDFGGYLEDSRLLDRLVREKLEEVAEAVRAEGWKWVETLAEYPYSYGAAMRRVYPKPVPLPETEQARRDALTAEYEALAAEHDGDNVPDEIAARLDALAEAIEGIHEAEAYRPEDIARGGAIVTVGHDGGLRIERGLVRREDEPAPEAEPAAAPDANGAEGEAAGREEADDAPEPEEDESAPLSDRLLADLTAHRTAALQEGLAAQPAVALAAIVHALALHTFYDGYDLGTCIEITPKATDLAPHAIGVGDGKAARGMALRHDRWGRCLPSDPAALWGWVLEADDAMRLDLLAYCVARTIDAVRRPWDRRPRQLDHADRLAQAVGLDMADHWTPTVGSYLGRVTKARIREAVAEGVSPEAPARIVGLKKPAMAAEAERLLDGTRWLPAVLRTAAPEERAASGEAEAVAPQAMDAAAE
jgi:ParB family chromosome partitioning protein